MNKQLDLIINNLDLSGGPNSWFDLWHAHLDISGNGNNPWDQRRLYLNQHFELFELICKKMNNYPHPFQVWIDIDERDGSQDAVYLHTNNPNDPTNFPVSFAKYETPEFENKELKEFLFKRSENMTIKGSKTYNEKGEFRGNNFFVYNENIGEKFI